MVEGVGEVLRLHGHPRIRPEDGTTRRMRVGPAGLMPLGGVAAGRATSRRRHGRGGIAHASSEWEPGSWVGGSARFYTAAGARPVPFRSVLFFIFVRSFSYICGIPFSYLWK